MYQDKKTMGRETTIYESFWDSIEIFVYVGVAVTQTMHKWIEV